jgi:hypothetical protein
MQREWKKIKTVKANRARRPDRRNIRCDRAQSGIINKAVSIITTPAARQV